MKKKTKGKLVGFTILKNEKHGWEGHMIKDDAHDHRVAGSVKKMVIARCKRVAKELGWNVKWK